MLTSRLSLLAAASFFAVGAGCAGPNLSNEITEFQAGVTALRSGLDPVVEPLANQERAAERVAGRNAFVLDEARADTEKKVEELLTACRSYFARDAAASLSDCSVKAYDPLPHPDFLWSASSDFLDALEVYVAEVLALASSTAPEEIAMNSAKLVASTSALLQEVGNPSGAERATNLAQPTSGLIGAFVNARKARVLRNEIMRADAAIVAGTRIIATGLDSVHPAPASAFETLVEAQRALVDSLEEGTPEERIAAMKRFETARNTYVQAERSSPVFALSQMTYAHNKLARAAARGANAEELLAAIKAMNEFLTAVKG